MGNWLITPNDGVTNPNTGIFGLPSLSTDKYYYITYVDDNGCSSNTYTYKYCAGGGPTPPSCDSFSDHYQLMSSNNIPAKPSGEYSLLVVGYCGDYSLFTYSSDKTWAHDAHESDDSYYVPCAPPAGGKIVKITVDENTSTDTRSFTFNLTGTTTAGTECTTAFTFTQDGATPPTPVDCPEDSQAYIKLSNTPAMGCEGETAGQYGFYKNRFDSVSSLEGDGTIVEGGSFYEMSSTPWGYGIVFSLTKNNTGAERTGTLTIKMNKDGGICTYTLPITQGTTCTQPSPSSSDCKIVFTNNLSQQIKDIKIFLYDGEGGVVAVVAGEAGDIQPGNTGTTTIYEGSPAIGKQVMSAVAVMHISGSTDKICKQCTCSEGFPITLAKSVTFHFDITNNTTMCP